MVSAVKMFHHFLYDHSFATVTNHKPLLGLFNKSKPTPYILSPCMLRWTLILNYYDFKLIFRPDKRTRMLTSFIDQKIKNADALSRLSRPAPDFEIPVPLEVLFIEDLEDPPLHASEIEKKMTERDPVLSRVLNCVLKG